MANLADPSSASSSRSYNTADEDSSKSGIFLVMPPAKRRAPAGAAAVNNKWMVKSIPVSLGQTIGAEDVVCILEMEGTKQVQKIPARVDGKIFEICCQLGETLLNQKQPLLKIQCSHEKQFGGLCADCGFDVSKIQKGTHVSMIHSTKSLVVSSKVAERVHNATRSGLLKAKRLILVCDLDQTLVHAAIDPTIHNWIEKHPNSNIYPIQLQKNVPTHFIRLRPGYKEFLDKLSKHFELHIYTFGIHNYASAVAQLLDPAGTLFHDRILSKEEGVTYKDLKRLFPVDSSMVVVIDDRADIWQCSPNLIKVKPYDFFVGAGDINFQEPNNDDEDNNSKPGENRSIFNPFSVKPKENDPDNELDNITKILMEIHSRFYSSEDLDSASVQDIMSNMRITVLHGVNIVFSGLIRTGVPQHLVTIWKLAEMFGATCSEQVIPNVTTHLVTNRDDTEKVHQAKELMYIYIVDERWLMDSIHSWRRQDEKNYPVKKIPVGGPDTVMEKYDELEEAARDALAEFGSDLSSSSASESENDSEDEESSVKDNAVLTTEEKEILDSSIGIVRKRKQPFPDDVELLSDKEAISQHEQQELRERDPDEPDDPQDPENPIEFDEYPDAEEVVKQYHGDYERKRQRLEIEEGLDVDKGIAEVLDRGDEADDEDDWISKLEEVLEEQG